MTNSVPSVYSNVRAFRQRFLHGLDMALAVYPQARVEIESKGLLLHPSAPPIEKRKLVVVSGGGGNAAAS